MKHGFWTVVVLLALGLGLGGCPAKEPAPPEAAAPEAVAPVEAVPPAPAAQPDSPELAAKLDKLEKSLDKLQANFQARLGGAGAASASSCPGVCNTLRNLCVESGKLCVLASEHPESSRAAQVCGRSRTLCLDDRSKALPVCGPCPEGS